MYIQANRTGGAPGCRSNRPQKAAGGPLDRVNDGQGTARLGLLVFNKLQFTIIVHCPRWLASVPAITRLECLR